MGKSVSRWTVGRILDEDSIKPWQYEHWIFPRAPDFFDRASARSAMPRCAEGLRTHDRSVRARQADRCDDGHMKRSTAIGHLVEMAEVASERLRLGSTASGWPLQ